MIKEKNFRPIYIYIYIVFVIFLMFKFILIYLLPVLFILKFEHLSEEKNSSQTKRRERI